MSDHMHPIKLQPLIEVRKHRRYFPAPLRYTIIGSWGTLLGIATFYLLRKLGY